MLVLLLPCAAACAGLRDDLVGTWHYEDRSGHWYTLVVSANGGFELYSEGLGAAGHYQATDDGTARFTYDGYSQLRQWPVGTVTLVSAVVQGDALTLTGSGQQAVTWQRMGNRISWGPGSLACLGAFVLLCAWAVYRLLTYVKHECGPRGWRVVGAGAAGGLAGVSLFVVVLVAVSVVPPIAWAALMWWCYGGHAWSHWWALLVFAVLFIGTNFLVMPALRWTWERLDVEARIERLFGSVRRK